MEAVVGIATLIFLALLLGVCVAQIIALIVTRRELARTRAQLEAVMRSSRQVVEHLERERDEAEEKALARAKDLMKKAEKALRADAVARSERSLKGKVAEQFAAFHAAFGYDPKDARFLGSPVDYVVFDGLSEGAVDQIVFVEIKTGRSGLTKRERQVMDAVDLGECSFEIVRIGG